MDEVIPDAIKQRFAGRDAAVARAYAASESFRDLCRDYLRCLATLGRWQASRSADAEVRSVEYGELLAELTKEIEARLQAGER